MPAFLASELPVRARTRHHWIVMLRPPHRLLTAALLVLLLAALLDPTPMAFFFGLVVAGIAFLRWRTWHAEWVILTRKRILRVRGVPETTSSETSLRIDRVSGARIIQSVPGKILDYGTIELEAPGDHPDVRRLVHIARPKQFYIEVRRVIFGDPQGASDLDEGTADHVTEPLPVLAPQERQIWRRRR